MSSRESEKLKMIIRLSEKNYAEVGAAISKNPEPITEENYNRYYYKTANKLSKPLSLKSALLIIAACGAVLQFVLHDKTECMDITLEDFKKDYLHDKLQHLIEVTGTGIEQISSICSKKQKITFDDLIDAADICSCNLNASFAEFSYTINSQDTDIQISQFISTNVKADSIISMYLDNPEMTVQEIARKHNCTSQYMYKVLNMADLPKRRIGKRE